MPRVLMNGFEVITASVPHRENLVVELSYDRVQVVEVSFEPEDDEPVVIFHNNYDDHSWSFGVHDFASALNALFEEVRNLYGIEVSLK